MDSNIGPSLCNICKINDLTNRNGTERNQIDQICRKGANGAQELSNPFKRIHTFLNYGVEKKKVEFFYYNRKIIVVYPLRMLKHLFKVKKVASSVTHPLPQKKVFTPTTFYKNKMFYQLPVRSIQVQSFYLNNLAKNANIPTELNTIRDNKGANRKVCLSFFNTCPCLSRVID